MTALPLDSICQQIIEAPAEAILVSDPAGSITFWNAGAERIFGFTPEEALGQSLDLIIPQPMQKRHWDGYHRVMAGAASRYAAGDLLRVPALRKDGQRISCQFSIVPLHDTDGQLAGMAAVLRDVTADWEREQALRARVRELEKDLETPTKN
jgi:PAS domain S-box-containing protein